MSAKRFIIAGGGTGGHIFPAVSIANEIRRRYEDAQILFVGAKGGMEMQVVPRHGYDIEAVWISGIHRQLTIRNIVRNLLFPIKLISSLNQGGKIIRRFRPDVVVGVGGYASGPVARVAAKRGIPLVLCEQNAFPGLVNRWLAPLASKILLGNADAAKYFPPEKTVLTGNPIREFALVPRDEAARSLGFDAEKPILLSLGGSLGAATINQALLAGVDQLTAAGVQLLWQCGKRYYEQLQPQLPEHPGLQLMAFIDDMALAYSAADLVISRAGGSTISELIALSKPAILVPSPNVAEDHQTKNARSLSDRKAAILVPDAEAQSRLVPAALEVLKDPRKLNELKTGIEHIEKHQAAKEIVDEIEKLL
ncbi:MAG: undecaprenyldiphospho-muramoylpentapeptide beta-N-acetylglucosaminyltransferase [Bacteroidetes bacterium]|nr:MAG: undecaprenyldiphospho-muramoylpentapeptide beta-N-acetylglucosaminyltransferase [Bacteroidota bacterium]